MPKTTPPAIWATDTCDYCGRPIALREIQTGASGVGQTWAHVGSDDMICRTNGIPVEIFDEWHERHVLSPAAVHWLATHGEAGDPQPIASGIELLRRLDTKCSASEAFDQRKQFEGNR